MELLQKLCRKSCANVVDGKMILTCRDAKTPVVWQMDLGEASASALEVRSGQGQSVLILKTLKGKETTIAEFDTKEQAVEVLMAASDALGNAQGKIRTAANTNMQGSAPRKKGGWFKKIFMTIAALAILFVGYSFLVVLGGISSGGGSSSSGRAAQQTQDSGGVPMSADDYLRGR